MAEKYGDVKSLSFQDKIAYYFQYYWKLALGIGIVLVVVIAGVMSILSNEKYDTSFLLVTRGKDLRASSEMVRALEAEVEKYAADTDGNGEVNVLADVVSFPEGSEDSATDSETAMQTRLAGEVQLGDSQMFIMDTTMYNYLLDLDGFMDLTGLFPDREIPLTYAIPLSETVLYDLEVPIPEGGLPVGTTLKKYNAQNKEILDDLVLVFRRDDELKPERRAVQLELFQIIVNAGFPQEQPAE